MTFVHIISFSTNLFFSTQVSFFVNNCAHFASQYRSTLHRPQIGSKNTCLCWTKIVDFGKVWAKISIKQQNKIQVIFIYFYNFSNKFPVFFARNPKMSRIWVFAKFVLSACITSVCWVCGSSPHYIIGTILAELPRGSRWCYIELN